MNCNYKFITQASSYLGRIWQAGGGRWRRRCVRIVAPEIIGALWSGIGRGKPKAAFLVSRVDTLASVFPLSSSILLPLLSSVTLPPTLRVVSAPSLQKDDFILPRLTPPVPNAPPYAYAALDCWCTD